MNKKKRRFVMGNTKIVSKATAETFSDQDNYPKVRELIAKRIRRVSEDPNMVGHYLYLVTPRSSKKLHEIFIDNIPEYARQYYRCNACFMFINRIGALVTIDDNGTLHSVCWDVPLEEVGMLAPAFNEMKKAVESGTVRNVFSYDEKNRFMEKSDTQELTLGIPVTGDWNHFYGILDLAHIYVPMDRVSEEEFREKLNIARENLNRWNTPAIKKAIAYAGSGDLYNKDKVKSMCEKLLSIVETYKITTNRNARLKLYFENNYLLYHIGGSSIGTLLDDFNNGVLSDAECIDRYNSKTDPIKYKRSKSAPSEATIKQAEILLKELGAENSIKRRFALMSDIPKFLWLPKDEKDVEEKYREGIFSKVKSKENEKEEYERIVTKGGNITLSKLITKVLPEAEKIDVYIGHNSRKDFCAYVTAVDMDSARIIKYDKPDKRNPISQYMYDSSTWPPHWNLFDVKAECVGIVNFPRDIYNDNISDTSVMFILKDCYDTLNDASALFADDLIPQLFPIRKVLESYSNQTPLEVPEGQKVCGVIISEHHVNINVRVYTKYSVIDYMIDRME